MLNGNAIPSIEISDQQEKENVQPQQGRRLSRSPHPYFRRQGTPADYLQREGRTSVQSGLEALDSQGSPGTIADSQNSGKGSKASTSPSDSGTEADDESGAILQSLPAPPARWRKGLKGGDGEGGASPLLTPSYLDDEGRRLELERQLSHHAGSQSPPSADDERRKLREKFTKRRRAELIRRVSETLILGVVGYVSSLRQISSVTGVSPPELWIYALTVGGIYILYPLRLLYRHSILSRHERLSRPFIRIPAAFDPATLLYPVLLPVFISCTMMPDYKYALLPNLVLGISSMPRAVLPFRDWAVEHNSFHWFLSSLPLALPSRLVHALQKDIVPRSSWHAEQMVLLYPLHQALLLTVGYLTSTSLLPAELQLLSVSMISLLLNSTSPQSIILRAILWIGGILIFVFCGYVLRVGVALARIPTWHFRHPQLRSRNNYVLLSAIDDCFHRRCSKWLSSLTQSNSRTGGGEEVDDMGDATACRPPSVRSKPVLPAHQRHETAAEGTMYDLRPEHTTESNGLQKTKKALHRSQRRHTMPSYLTCLPVGCNHLDSKPRLAKRKTRPLAHLTSAQASVLKWTFAGYVYGIVITIIVLPVRKYIKQNALRGWEPVGWALGYLLGNIPAFRQIIIQWELDDWVALPEPYNGMNGNIWNGNLKDCIHGPANRRLLICFYCLSVIAVGLGTVFRLSAYVEVDTRRKVFHGMMVIMFLPCIFVDPAFVALAFSLILAVFLLLDLFRASQLPPLSGPLTKFLAPYVDGRDYRGPVVVSHMFLLIGCAIPLWLSLSNTRMAGEPPWEGWHAASRDLGMVSGVICVGMGDAAASLIGRRYGRRRWCWSGGKSLEGSFAFSLAVILGLALGRAWLLWGGWDDGSGDPWSLMLGKAAVAATGASLTEAVLTGGNDNVIVPVILWLLVRGLKI